MLLAASAALAGRPAVAAPTALTALDSSPEHGTRSRCAHRAQASLGLHHEPLGKGLAMRLHRYSQNLYRHPLASILLAASSHNAVRRLAGPRITSLRQWRKLLFGERRPSPTSHSADRRISAALPAAAEATRSQGGLQGEPPYHSSDSAQLPGCPATTRPSGLPITLRWRRPTTLRRP